MLPNTITLSRLAALRLNGFGSLFAELTSGKRQLEGGISCLAIQEIGPR